MGEGRLICSKYCFNSCFDSCTVYFLPIIQPQTSDILSVEPICHEVLYKILHLERLRLLCVTALYSGGQYFCPDATPVPQPPILPPPHPTPPPLSSCGTSHPPPPPSYTPLFEHRLVEIHAMLGIQAEILTPRVPSRLIDTYRHQACRGWETNWKKSQLY